MQFALKAPPKKPAGSPRTILTLSGDDDKMELPRGKARSGTGISLGIQSTRGGKEMGKRKYSSDLPRRMYTYFTTYGEGVGAPSFSKFARCIGVTLDELLSFRKHEKFDRAYRECSEIRRDYLIDMALNKRFDSSFTKFLLSEIERTATEDNEEFKFTLEVLN